MAKYYSSTFGKISGKHGTAVAVIMKNGTTYLREYKKPSNPRTDKQQAHRAKFALASTALVPFNPIFKDTIGITHGISIARSYAFKNAIVGEYPNFSMDYDKLMFSFGSLEKLQNASVTSNEGIMTLNWELKKMHNCHANDSISIVVFDKQNNQSTHLKDVAKRSDKECKIEINEEWENSELYLWAYVTSGDKKSDSVFVPKYAETDLYLSSEEIPADNKYTDSPTHISINQSIMTFIMMLLNLINIFRIIAPKTNNQIITQHIACKINRVTEHVVNRYNETALLLNLKGAMRTALEAQRVYTARARLIPISIKDTHPIMV